MRVFIAGASGVLGRRVVALLVGAGHDVSGVARSDGRAILLEGLGATPIRVELFDADAMTRAVAGHDVVCNLATHIPPTFKATRPGAWVENDRIRNEASRILADASLAGEVPRYVQESIAFLYRDGGPHWLDESSPIDPVAGLRSATVAESSAARVTASGAIGVTLRFGAFYGPDSESSLAMIKLAKRRIALNAGPDRYVSSITTDDAAAAVVAAASAPAGLYNIGDDDPVTCREYFAALAGALGVRPPFIAPAGLAKLGGAMVAAVTRSQRVSNGAFVEATGWRPVQPSVREGWPVVAAAAAT
ncbi:MAG TPA: NAD(P)H-binding protein [Acidimicrobiales bacterium]|nr:NAD(P)H-binding protein [Acidimicrobiales bacterium]